MSAVENGGNNEIIKEEPQITLHNDDEELKSELKTETADVSQIKEIKTEKSDEVKTPVKMRSKSGFFSNFRRRIRSIFRRRKRTSKLEETEQVKEEVIENAPEQIPDHPHESPEQDRASQHISPSPKKVPIFMNDLTAELKTTLKQRSRDDPAPSSKKADLDLSEMIAAGARSTSFCDEDLPSPRDFEINQEGRELKSFVEKRALFESQTSGGGEASLTRSEKRVSSSVGAAATSDKEGDDVTPALHDDVTGNNDDVLTEKTDANDLICNNDVTSGAGDIIVKNNEESIDVAVVCQNGAGGDVASSHENDIVTPEVKEYGDSVCERKEMQGEDVVIKEFDELINTHDDTGVENTANNDDEEKESTTKLGMDKMIAHMCQDIIDSSLQEYSRENVVNGNSENGHIE